MKMKVDYRYNQFNSFYSIYLTVTSLPENIMEMFDWELFDNIKDEYENENENEYENENENENENQIFIKFGGSYYIEVYLESKNKEKLREVSHKIESWIKEYLIQLREKISFETVREYLF